MHSFMLFSLLSVFLCLSTQLFGAHALYQFQTTDGATVPVGDTFGAAVNAGLWVKANLTKPYDRRAVAFVQGVYFFGIAAARATFDEGWRADQLGFALNPLGVLGNLYGSDIFVGYHSTEVKNATDSASFESAGFAMRAIFRELVEYEDVDKDGAYTPKVDKVVRQVNLWIPAVTWAPNAYTTVKIHGSDLNATEAVVHQVSSCATGLFQNVGSVCITYHYAPIDVVNEKFNATLTPNALKQDIEIKNYPWSTTANTSLAIKVLVASAGSRTLVDVPKNNDGDLVTPDDQAQVRVAGSADVEAGFFSWSGKVFTNAAASGKTAGVKVSSLLEASNSSVSLMAGWSASEIYITMGGPEHSDYLLLDPAIGVHVSNGMKPEVKAAIGGTIGAVVLCGCLVFGVVYWRKNKRAKYTEV